MPCKNCETQFNLFKRKRACNSCCLLYCGNCLSKRDKNYCQKCHLILLGFRSKSQLMQLNTKVICNYSYNYRVINHSPPLGFKILSSIEKN